MWVNTEGVKLFEHYDEAGITPPYKEKQQEVMPKLKTTVGLAAGIFDPRGKLLLRRRVEHDSITGIDYAGCWELPVAAAREIDSESIPYDYLSQELTRGVKEELGIVLCINPMPAFYPVMFKGPQGYDLAMVTPVQIINDVDALVLIGEIIFVSPQELHKLAKEYEPVKKDKAGKIIQGGKGLLSGVGKRQYYMAMKVFEVGSSNKAYREEARYMLEKAHQGIFFT